MDPQHLTRRRRLWRWLSQVTADKTWTPPSPSAWDEDGNAHAVWEREGPPRAPWVWQLAFLGLFVVLVGWGALLQWAST